MIECKVCKLQFRNLTSHLSAKHSMSVPLYRQIYDVKHIMDSDLRRGVRSYFEKKQLLRKFGKGILQLLMIK